MTHESNTLHPIYHLNYFHFHTAIYFLMLQINLHLRQIACPWLLSYLLRGDPPCTRVGVQTQPKLICRSIHPSIHPSTQIGLAREVRCVRLLTEHLCRWLVIAAELHRCLRWCEKWTAVQEKAASIQLGRKNYRSQTHRQRGNCASALRYLSHYLRQNRIRSEKGNLTAVINVSAVTQAINNTLLYSKT